MRRIVIFILLLFFAGCSSLQVQNDYNPRYDFSKLRSFAVLTPEKGSIVTLTQERLKNAVTQTLKAKGYTPAPKNEADFWVMFHTDVTRMREVVNDYESLGLYPYDYGYWGPAYIPSRYEYTYDEAKIVIDALDPSNKKVFFVVRKILASFPAARSGAKNLH